MSDEDQLRMYTRESIAQDFMPETPNGIRQFYATVRESSSVDIMIGAVYAEYLLDEIAALTSKLEVIQRHYSMLETQNFDLTHAKEQAEREWSLLRDNASAAVAARDRVLREIAEVAEEIVSGANHAPPLARRILALIGEVK